MSEKTYLCIDLKSFYASVECVERGLDPLDTNLVVADRGRTEKTICLAVSPSLKSFGIGGRSRLFEVVQTVKEENAKRRFKAPNKTLEESSYIYSDLKNNPYKEIDYIIAPPRMACYMEYSSKIYDIYLRYISADDIHVYSVDEVFMDITNYLKTGKKTPYDFAMTIIKDVLKETGITATAGIGTNMYLAKIAMDIEAKHQKPDKDGVRIASLTEESYRKNLWGHTPITDFWRVGKGIAKRLAEVGLYTMGDIAKCSVGSPFDYYNEELLYKIFGINAELLIDHAWGYEPCTIDLIKKYKPQSSSLGSGQVLHVPYTFQKARLILKEMTELIVLDLVEKRLLTNQMVLTVGYDIENLTDEKIRAKYTGEITTDHYGRKVPKAAHGTVNLGKYTSSTRYIMEKVVKLFNEIVNKDLLVRRINIVANNISYEKDINCEKDFVQLEIFGNNNCDEEKLLEKERSIQKTMIEIKKKHGKNAIVKGMNLEDGATTMDRNKQIGGHKA